jgi:sugar lactone lactonase YvrE
MKANPYLKSRAGVVAAAVGSALVLGGCASTQTSTGPAPFVVSASPPPPLNVEAEFPHQQVTGVAVSRTGRVFVNFPYWSDGHTVSVAELDAAGQPRPFPDENWNVKTAPPADRFVCVQSVYVDDTDALWIVDAGSPKQTGVVEGGAKLVKVNLGDNRVAQVIHFDRRAAPEKSYLNDVRVDTKNQFAFLTDSNLGAIVVVDLKTDTARRVLDNDPSVKPEPNLALKVEGNVLIDPEKQRPLAIASDGIALDPVGGWLYYKALTGHTLYRIPTEALENEQLADQELANRIERVGRVPASDGLAFRDGKIYVSSIEDDSVVRYDVTTKTSEVVVRDERLKWPDSFAFGPDGTLYVTSSQIHLTPKFNDGATRVREPFRVFKMPLNDTVAAAE